MSATPLRTAIRPPLVDGLFYPARKEALAEAVDELVSGPHEERGRSFGIISPHAGYEQAGAVMGAAFRAIAERPVRTAVVIGPVHRDAEDVIYLPESTTFATPLGPVPVDGEAVAALERSDARYRRSDIPHLEEHCLELQLPFLLRLFPGLSVVPLLVGAGGKAGVETLARSLDSIFGPREASTVIVVTANVASYMTGRDTDVESAEAEALIRRRDWKGLLAAAAARKVSACGVTCIAALLRLLGETCRVRVLARGRSREEEPPNDDGVDDAVHYAAVSVDRGAA